MPLPEGFEPIETKGVQKRQKTDTVIITKSGDIYIGGIVRDRCGINENKVYYATLGFNKGQLCIAFDGIKISNTHSLKLVNGKLHAKSKFSVIENQFIKKFMNPEDFERSDLNKATYIWIVDYFERYRDSEGKYFCTDNIKETREHREEFAIINNLPALKLEYEPVDWSKKGKYFVINVEKPRRIVPIDISGKLTKYHRHSQKKKVD